MKTLLVIDEDGDVALALAEALAGRGVRVERLADPRLALDAIYALSPDLVVVDVVFPDDPAMGFGLARHIRRQPDLRDIPIVLTAVPAELADLGFRFQGADLRGDWLDVEEFVAKPCSPDDLLARLERFF